MSDLTDNEKKVVVRLLERAADQFSNHCCNDIDLEELTQEEQIALDKKIHEWNGDPEEHDPNSIAFSDWILMSYFAARLKGDAK